MHCPYCRFPVIVAMIPSPHVLVTETERTCAHCGCKMLFRMEILSPATEEWMTNQKGTKRVNSGQAAHAYCRGCSNPVPIADMEIAVGLCRTCQDKLKAQGTTASQ